jgi:hypothetical protein
VLSLLDDLVRISQSWEGSYTNPVAFAASVKFKSAFEKRNSVRSRASSLLRSAQTLCFGEWNDPASGAFSGRAVI